MSLCEALLLEEYRDARQIFIALRKDHARGSGTQEDPYDGSVRPYVSIAVKSLTNLAYLVPPLDSFTLDALLETAIPHGFSEGDAVTISGVDASSSSNAFFMGSFQITNVTERTIKFSNWVCNWLGQPSSPTAPGTTITVVRERELFDTI